MSVVRFFFWEFVWRGLSCFSVCFLSVGSVVRCFAWASFMCGLRPAFYQLVDVDALLLPGLWFVVLFLGFKVFLLLQLRCDGEFIFFVVQCESYCFLVYVVMVLCLRLSYVLWRYPVSLIFGMCMF